MKIKWGRVLTLSFSYKTRHLILINIKHKTCHLIFSFHLDLFIIFINLSHVFFLFMQKKKLNSHSSHILFHYGEKSRLNNSIVPISVGKSQVSSLFFYQLVLYLRQNNKLKGLNWEFSHSIVTSDTVTATSLCLWSLPRIITLAWHMIEFFLKLKKWKKPNWDKKKWKKMLTRDT